MKKVWSLLMAFMLFLGIFTLVCGVNTVKAADIASGTYDGVSWRITDAGELILGNGGTQTMTYRESRDQYSWPWRYNKSNIKSISIDGTVKGNGSLNLMFYSTPNVITADLRGLDITNVTNIGGLFNSCSKIQTIDISTWNGSNRITDMNNTFYNCPELALIDGISNLNVDKVTTLYGTFASCPKLISLDLTSWNTSNVTEMRGTFHTTSGIKELNLNGWDTSHVTDMQWMFQDCSSLTSLDISSFNTENVLNMERFFSGTYNLKSVKLGERFSFKGNNITNVSRQGMLISPSSGGMYTGKWVREDYLYGPYTSAQLRDNYTSEMAGTWVWETSPCAVFTEDGTLYFIRPTADSTYTSGQTGSVTSISGGVYTGQVFSVDESTTYSGNNGNRPWSVIASQVKAVKFVDEVHPRNTYRWFQQFTNCTEFDVAKLNMSNVGDMGLMFLSCDAIEQLDLTMWNTSSATNMYGVFLGCDNLTSLNLSGWNTSNVTNMGSIFMECYKLEYLNINTFDTSKATTLYTAFGKTVIKKVVLGEKFKPQGANIANVNHQANLPIPSGDLYTGKWIREDKAFGPYTSAELRDNYTPVMAGTWIWELAPVEYKISFEAGENGTGAMQSVNGPAKEDFTLPANQFVAFGYEFDHWDDGNGKTYVDKATVPANTYAADTTVTLTAVFKKRDTSLNWDGNEATFSIRGGEQAVLDNIPAGTSYQVYELTPDGWVLVQQENASGVIEALEESSAAFWNKYQPGVTTVQFSGLKNLDGRPASAGSFTFELYEGETLVDTATTQDGGFIQFKVIEYDAAGDHVYTIREVDPNDDSIDYDTHEETVEVSVTDNGDGTLSSEVTYDDDGIVFSNTTRPGTLRITKDATNGTSANANDKFTIEIEFRNESGMPINDNIYWYVEGGATTPSEISGGNQE